MPRLVDGTCCSQQLGDEAAADIEIEVSEDPSEDGNGNVLSLRCDASDDECVLPTSLEPQIALSMKAEMGGRQPTETLSVNLRDFTLLRATTLVHVLAGFGCHFRTASLANSIYTEQEAARLYSKSKPMDKLDFFISHCWMDDRWGKTAALWIHSNLKAAMVAATAVAALFALLARLDVLPRQRIDEDLAVFPWALYSGTLTFFIVLAFCHILLARWTRKTYFLDKFCVHQTDEVRKQKGVASFAAFVSGADRMLLLWSPRYFERLWCTLEVAALVKSCGGTGGKAPLRLDFLPLQMAKVNITAWGVISVIFCTFQTNRILGNPLPDVIFACLLIVVGSSTTVLTLRPYGRARKALEQQLRSFDVKEAKCASPADRRTVERALLRWFTDLDMFNKHVREGVADQVLNTLGGEAHYPTQMVLPLLMISLFSDADYAAGGFFETDSFWRLARLLGWSAFMLCVVPLTHRICFYFRELRSTSFREVLTNIAVSMLVGFVWIFGYVGNYFLVVPTVLSGWMCLLPVAEWMLFFWLQRETFSLRALPRARLSQAQAQAEAEAEAAADPNRC